MQCLPSSDIEQAILGTHAVVGITARQIPARLAKDKWAVSVVVEIVFIKCGEMRITAEAGGLRAFGCVAGEIVGGDG